MSRTITSRALSLHCCQQVRTILRLLKAMAISKFNTFHWHLTDGQSFPLHLDALPELAAKVPHTHILAHTQSKQQSLPSPHHSLLCLLAQGAWSDDKIYSHKDVATIVDYARDLGIR